MPITPKQMVKILKKNGFIEIRQVGSHKRFENPITGKSTTVPYHSKDLSKGTEQAIFKQAGLK
jgi:Predicted periplasmic or secreted lipoprotein